MGNKSKSLLQSSNMRMIPKFSIIFGIIFFVGIVGTLDLVPKAGAAYENLYVSRDVAEEKLQELLEFDYEYVFKESTGCNSYAPKNWDLRSNIRYIDRMNPSFEIAFSKNEFPLTIDTTTFKTSDFSNGSKTVKIETGKPIQLKLLLFENTGPQNVEKIILFTNTIEINFTTMQSDTYIIFEKINPDSIGPPIYDYIYGGVEEDPYRSWTYPNKLGIYSVMVNDPHNFFSEVTASAKRVDPKIEVIFEITFAQAMEKTNLIITAIDADNNAMMCKIKDAWEANDSSSENIPSWMDTNFKWRGEGLISDADLAEAIKYLQSLAGQN